MSDFGEWYAYLLAKAHTAATWAHDWVQRLQLREWFYFFWLKLAEGWRVALEHARTATAWLKPKLVLCGRFLLDQFWQLWHSAVLQDFLRKMIDPEGIMFWIVIGIIVFLPIVWFLRPKPDVESQYQE